jgi:aminoglycoside phosphotransferase (APT) family kinase protein
MQEGWGRRYELLTLDHETLATLMEPVAAGRAIATAEPVGGGLVNTNYRVTLDGLDGAFVLRLYVRDPSACHLECDINRLAHERVPMPDILYADPGGERFGRPYMVTRWVEGLKLDTLIAGSDGATIGAAAEAVGATLAALSSYHFAEPGFFGPELTIRQPLGTPRENVVGYVQQCLFERGAGQRLGDDLTRRVWALLTEHAEMLDALDGPATLVHGDYKAQNLLLRQRADGGDTWEMAAVLDWEFACATTPFFDLAILLRYADTLPPAFEHGVIAGYQRAGGSLPREWKRITKLLDLLNLCDFLTTPNPRDAMVADVTRLLCATIEGWESYA